MTTKIMTTGVLGKFCDLYMENIPVVAVMPDGQRYAITSAMMRSVGSDTPLVFELLTEKDFDMKKIEPIKIDETSIGRDNFQP